MPAGHVIANFLPLAAMGRTRTKSKKAQVATASTPAVPKSEPSIEALLEKAQVLIAQCDYDLACKFSKRILERSPSHADAKEIMGVCQLETGDLDAARQVSQSWHCIRSVLIPMRS